MKFILNKDTLEVDDAAVGNSGSVNYYEAEVEYDESWNNLNIEAVIVKRKKGGGCEDTGTGTSVAVINNKFFIDKKLSGDYYIGFVGYTIENDKKIYQISSTLKYIYFKKGAGEIETENEELPTPTEWEIYIAQIKSIVSDIEGLSDELNKKVAEVESKLESGELNGKDATINGRNAIEIEAGNNIEIEETENGIKINSTGGGPGSGAVNSVNGKTGKVKLNAEDVGALPNTTKIPTKTSDLRNDSNFVSDENYTHTDNNFLNEEKEKLSQLENYDDTQVKSDINTIKEKIPTQATNNNQLADKDFVNSSLNSITAFYITKNADGDQFNSKAELDSATEFYSGGEVRVPTRNDYCIVLEDETKDNSTTRYIYQNNQWEFQYVVNETPLTSEQIKAINSGITLELVAKLQGINLTDVQIDGESIVTNGIATIPIASRNKPLTSGLVAIQPAYGISTNSSNVLMIGAPSGESEISQRKSVNSSRLDANKIDYVVKVAMCDGVGAEWTDEEKANSRARMGISEHITLTQSEYDALVEAGTVDENTYYYIKEE